MPYVLLLWTHSADSTKIVRLQKKMLESWWVVDIVTVVEQFFLNLEIIPHPSEYILSLLMFEIKNRNKFLVNSKIYHIDTRQHANFHQPSVN